MNEDIQKKIEAARKVGVSEEAIQQRLQQRGIVDQPQDEGFKFSSLFPTAGGIIGGIGGGLISSPSIFGIPAGVIAGGAVGSAGGEALRQRIENEEFNPTGIAAEGAMGLAGGPIGKLAGVPLKWLGRGLFRLALGPGGGAAVDLGLKGGSPQAIKQQLFEGSGSIVEKLKERLGGLLEGKTGISVGELKDLILGLGRNPEVVGIEEKGLETLPSNLMKRKNMTPLQQAQANIFNKLNELLATAEKNVPKFQTSLKPKGGEPISIPQSGAQNRTIRLDTRTKIGNIRETPTSPTFEEALAGTPKSSGYKGPVMTPRTMIQNLLQSTSQPYSDVTKIPLGDLDLLKQLAQTTGTTAFNKETPYAVPEFASRLSGILRKNIEKASGQPEIVGRLNELIGSAGKIGENLSTQMGFGRRFGVPIGAASIPSLVGLLTGNPLGGLAIGGGALALTNPKIGSTVASALLSKLFEKGLFGAGQISARIPKLFNNE